MPIQADIKEKNASRSGSLISMALAFVIHMSGAVMTYMPIGNSGTEGQWGHKGKGSRGGSAGKDSVLGGMHGAPWSWVVSLGARAADLSHSSFSINENLVEPPGLGWGF